MFKWNDGESANQIDIQELNNCYEVFIQYISTWYENKEGGRGIESYGIYLCQRLRE